MPQTSRNYDPSGQVYTETLLPAKPATSNNWSTKTRASPQEHTSHISPLGAPSFRSACMRTFLTHSPFVTTATLSSLPWSIASEIWDKLDSNQLLSTKLWCNLVSAFPDETAKSQRSGGGGGGGKLAQQNGKGASKGKNNKAQARHHRVRHLTQISRPHKYPLDAFLEPLLEIGEKDMSGRWTTALTLQHVSASRRAMIQGIAGLRNLVCLTIGDGVACEPGIQVDNAVLREWGRHAVEGAATNGFAERDRDAKCGREQEGRHRGRPFGMLRVLNLGLQAYISAKCFGYLAPLPLLSVINVDRCGIKYADDEVAEDAGWTPVEPDSSCPLVNVIFGILKSTDWNILAETSLQVARELEKGPGGAEADFVLPRLHLLLGKNDLEPLYEGFNPAPGMRTFFRVPRSKQRRRGSGICGSKRSLSDDEREVIGTAKKKRAFKPPKQQISTDLWSGIAASFPV